MPNEVLPEAWKPVFTPDTGSGSASFAPVPTPRGRNVYQCIVAASADIAAVGLSKTRKNETQGYPFRGIDDVYNLIAPILAKHHLVILPRILSRDISERQTKSGSIMFSVTVEAEFDLVSADDGSKHTIRTYGEAMDNADKATNKAMSAAYKYAAFQAFAIPTEGDNDADASHHEAKAKPLMQPLPPQKTYALKPEATPRDPLQDPLLVKVTPVLSIKQTLWDNLKVHCNGKNGEAGKILKHLTGKQFISDVTEDEAAVARVKFEADFLGEVRE